MFFIFAAVPHFENGWKNRNEYDDQYDFREVLLDDGNLAEEISRQSQGEYPDQSPDDVIENKAAVSHVAHTGDKGCERTNDRNETGEYDGFSAVFVKEFLRFL